MFLKKIFLSLQEHLPGRRIFFIYTHKNGHDRFANGLKANTEISFFSYSALKEAFSRVIFLRLEGEKKEKIERIKADDVVIGHVGETFLRAACRTKNMIAFYPWAGHLDRVENTLFNCLPKEQELHYLSFARSLILLTSEYNKSTYIDQPKNFWHSFFQTWVREGKALRIVHQPIDLTLFQRIKRDYTTSHFLYIGNDAHMKGLNVTRELVKSIDRRLTVYGVGDKKLDNLDVKAVKKLGEEADFFIHHGMWEAQCVSILEAAARGFIPIVTEETGYPYKHPFLLRYGKREYNLKVLKELLSLNSNERKQLGDSLYHQLSQDQNHNTWEILGKILVEEVKKLLGNCHNSFFF